MKIIKNVPRYPLSQKSFHPHYSGAYRFNSQRNDELYTVQMLRKAYRFSEQADASGVKVAIVAAFDNEGIEENLRVFTSEFGISMPKVTRHYPDGISQTFSRSWLIESSLDIQWVSAFAQGAEMDVVFAKPPCLRICFLP